MHAELLLTPEEITARWRELAADPQAPEFYELNEFGEIILSPSPSNKHELIAFEIAKALEAKLGRRGSAAVSVLTDRGVKRPDATWMPADRWQASGYADPLPFAPDICVEVMSPGNTQPEIQMKVGAYLCAGAQEVIVVGLDAMISFFGPKGLRAQSAFGLQLTLPPDLF